MKFRGISLSIIKRLNEPTDTITPWSSICETDPRRYVICTLGWNCCRGDTRKAGLKKTGPARRLVGIRPGSPRNRWQSTVKTRSKWTTGPLPFRRRRLVSRDRPAATTSRRRPPSPNSISHFRRSTKRTNPPNLPKGMKHITTFVRKPNDKLCVYRVILKIGTRVTASSRFNVKDVYSSRCFVLRRLTRVRQS